MARLEGAPDTPADEPSSSAFDRLLETSYDRGDPSARRSTASSRSSFVFMMLLHLLHSALVVSDLGRSRGFYETVLGLVPIERPLTFPGVWYQIGSFQIHLLQSDQIIADGVDPDRWGRNRHLAFAVEDLAATIAHLQSQQWPYQSSASGRAAIFVQDPDGNVLELQESPR